MVENCIKSGICYVIRRYAKANNKYMKNYDPNRELSYLMYWDVNNLCGRAMSQKLPVHGLKQKNKKSKSTQKFLHNYDDDCNKGYFLEAGVSCSKRLQKIRRVSPILAWKNED